MKCDGFWKGVGMLSLALGLTLSLLGCEQSRRNGETEPEGEYLEVFRLHVRADSDAVTMEVMGDTLEGIGEAVSLEGLGDLLTFSAEVSQVTADALRDPAALAGEA